MLVEDLHLLLTGLSTKPLACSFANYLSRTLGARTGIFRNVILRKLEASDSPHTGYGNMMSVILEATSQKAHSQIPSTAKSDFPRGTKRNASILATVSRNPQGPESHILLSLEGLEIYK